jgi:predicted porin
MESYFFKYTYSNPPAINGVAAPQSYIGLGFAPVGTYKAGQTINVLDKATGLRQVGTYQIGNVNDTVALDATKLNHLTVSEYDWGSQRFITGTGLQNNTALGAAGLGSEGGALLGFGAFGTNASFNNQNPAIRPIHF